MGLQLRLRQGIAVPLVLLFCLVTFTFLFSMVGTRSRMRKQTLSTHTQKKAYYLAQGGIQQALLKLRLLHRKAYDAGAMARGVCPFLNPYENNVVSNANASRVASKALDIFISDLKSTSISPNLALRLTGGEYPIPTSGTTQWKYEVTEFNVETYYMQSDGSVKEVAHIKAMGYAFDPRDLVPERRELVEKSVELTRKIK